MVKILETLESKIILAGDESTLYWPTNAIGGINSYESHLCGYPLRLAYYTRHHFYEPGSKET